jgi:predicted permease
MSFLDNRDLAAETNIFAGVAGSAYDAASLRVGDTVDWVWQESATANFFDLLGVEPVLGRFFLPAEDTHPGGDNVAVLSYGLWQRRFGGDRKILGRVIEISNRPFTVVGVAPASFGGGMGGLHFDLWIPVSMTLEFTNTAEAFSHRNWRFLHTYARLQPETTGAQAQAAASAVMRRLAGEYADTNRDTDIAVLPVWKSPWGGQAVFLPLLRSLAVVAVLLLLLVAANIANLLLARASVRQQELAVRLALGAGRVRLVRQLLVENVLLAGLGGVAGCFFASWGVSLLFKLMPSTYLPIGYNVQLNGTVLFFCALITLASGILFGLAPAWQATKTNLNDTLKQSGRTGASARGVGWLRNALVVSEVALALVLLAGMALCARSLERAGKIDLGLDPSNVWVAGFRLPPVGYDEDHIHNIYRRLRRDLAGLPGVESVALADWLPLGFEGGSSSRFAVDGYQPAPGELMSAGVSAVSPDYFRTLRIPVLAGRGFADRDDINAPRVAVVNQFLADRYFAGRDPVGLRIRLWGDEWTIAGVARTGKYRALNEPARNFIYVPQYQVLGRSGGVVVRTIGDPRGIAHSVERAAVAIDPLLKPVAALTMTDYTAAAFAIPRVAATLLTALGTVALLLAALGIYGVIAGSVNQRTREIGIRMALGAQQLDVLRLFVRQGMKLAGAGVLIGLAGTLAAAQVLSSLLIGVGASDPPTYLAVALLLAAVALLACWLPARRASKVDPMEALRYE